jgi:predicted Zn-dependent protease
MKQRGITRILAVMLLLVGCTSSPRAGDATLFEGLDENIERRLLIRADEETRNIDAGGLLYDDKELEQYVNAVARKLQGSAEGRAVTVKVIKNPYLSAFAMSNGRIYLHTGMLAAMENEAQLATILGHEMAHVSNRHAAKKYTKERIRSESKVTLNSWLGAFGESLGQFAIMASVNWYSREFEAEADREGIKRAVRAGYDPREAPKMYALLMQEIDKKKKKIPLAYSDHPYIQDRIKNCEEMIASEYHGKEGASNEEDFRRRTNPLLLDTAVLDLKLGDFAVAERIVEKHLKWKSDDARAYFLLGEIARGQGQVGGEQKAIAHYRKAVSLRKNYAEPYRAMGLMAYKKGDKQEAKKNLEGYLALRSDASDADYIRQYINECK